MSDFEEALYQLDRARTNVDHDEFGGASHNMDEAFSVIDEEIQLLQQQTPITELFETAQNSVREQNGPAAVDAMTEMIEILQNAQAASFQLHNQDSR